MVGGYEAFYLKIWVNRPPVGAKSPIWTDIRP